MSLKTVFVLAGALFINACASGGPAADPASHSAAAPLNQPQRLLSLARKLKAEKSCAEAAPTYRVIASFGDGHEVAQYELGACLLEAAGVNDNETALFREESLFWLRRAAWAGNARAQWRLASILSGGGADQAGGVAASPVEAMGWALVYAENAAHELYGLAPVHPQNMAHLHEALPAALMADAAAFAAGYREIKMAGFTPPANSRGGGRDRGAHDQRGHGDQRRRR